MVVIALASTLQSGPLRPERCRVMAGRCSEFGAGTVGLMERPVDAVPLDLDLFTGNLLRVGGTFLGSVNSGDPFEYKTSNNRTIDRSDDIIDGYRSLSLDALIGIGGDGSLLLYTA